MRKRSGGLKRMAVYGYGVGLSLWLLSAGNVGAAERGAELFATPERVALSAADRNFLGKLQIPETAFAEKTLPAFWKLNVGLLNQKSYPFDFSFKDRIFQVSTRGQLPFFLAPYYPAYQRMRLSLTLSGRGEVSIGYYAYPYLASRPVAKPSRHTVDTDKPVVMEQIYDLSGVDLSIQSFRVALTLSGNLAVSGLAVEPAPEKNHAVVEGEITAVSQLPDPGASAYPDCLYTATFRGKQILDGDQVPQELQLLIPGFLKYTATEYAHLKVGDKLRLAISAFDALPEALQSIQQADDLARVDLEPFFMKRGIRIQQYAMIANPVAFRGAVAYESKFENPVNPPIAKAAQEAQRKAIMDEQRKIQKLMASLDGRRNELEQCFAEWMKHPAGAEELQIGPRRYWWLKRDNSFWAIQISQRKLLPERPIAEANIEAIQALNRYLNAQGVQFIIQVIPDYFDIAPRVMNPDFSTVPDTASAQCVRQLLDAGIEAVYVADELVKNYHRKEMMFFYPNNKHPHDGCQIVLAENMASRLARHAGRLSPKADLAKWTTVRKISGYHDQHQWPAGVDIGRHRPGESFECDTIYYDGKPFSSRADSSILVIGNSFLQTPMEDFSYIAHLGRLLNVNPQQLRISAFGPLVNIPMALYREPERYLKNKVVCILPLHVSYLTTERQFINLEQLDRDLKTLSGKTHRLSIEPRAEHRVDDHFYQTLPGNVVPQYPTYWKKFIQLYQPVIPMYYPKPAIYTLAQTEIPAEYRQHDSCVVVEAAAFTRQRVSIGVNGRFKEIPFANAEVNLFKLVFEIPRHSERLHIEVKTWQPDTLMAVKGVSFFQ